MKKRRFQCLIVLFCALFVVCSLASCSFLSSYFEYTYREINVRGIENFKTDKTYDSMCHYLIPDGFITAFEAEGSEFVYTDHGDFQNTDVSAMLWFRYADEESYEAAKAYYLSHMTLADSDYTTLGDITFREIEGYAKKDGGAKSAFPYKYTMFAWSDEARVLIAFGSHEDPIGVEPERWLVYLTGRYPYVNWKTGLLRE